MAALPDDVAMERRRQRGPRDALPSPERLARELRELIGSAVELERLYRRAYVLGLSSAGGLPVAGTSRGSSPTERAVEARAQAVMRDGARRAVRRVRDATRQLGNALADLRFAEPAFVQPPRPAVDALVSLAEFLESLEAKRRREERGEE